MGKCGGTTIYKTLKENGVNFYYIHGLHPRPKYQPGKKYFITIRNPVDRFVSAFYWRKRLTHNEQRHRFAGEYEFFKKYPTIEDLIRDDISMLQKQYVHHINEDIDHYLGAFVDQCDPKAVLGIACTETLDRDLKAIFNIDIKNHENNNKSKKPLTEDNRKILKNYIHKDYLVIEKLYKINLLSKEQYEILSK